MAYRKSYFQEITIAANANQQFFNLNTPDNFQQQRIMALYTDDTTARHVYGLQVTGDLKMTVNAPRFAAGNEPVYVDITVPPQIPPVLVAQDLTGTGKANVGVTIWYEVDQP